MSLTALSEAASPLADSARRNVVGMTSGMRKQLAVLPIVMQLLNLNLEQSGLHSRGAAQPPQYARQSQHDRLLGDYRSALGRQLHAAVERVIDGEVLALANAAKKPPAAA